MDRVSPRRNANICALWLMKYPKFDENIARYRWAIERAWSYARFIAFQRRFHRSGVLCRSAGRRACDLSTSGNVDAMLRASIHVIEMYSVVRWRFSVRGKLSSCIRRVHVSYNIHGVSSRKLRVTGYRSESHRRWRISLSIEIHSAKFAQDFALRPSIRRLIAFRNCSILKNV